MIVYRLSTKKYAKDLSGTGAKIYGGRWNRKGTPIVYTAESRALAFSELLVRVSLPDTPLNYVMVSIEIPDDVLLEEIHIKDLPSDWNRFPWPYKLQEVGSAWAAANKSLILKVPSVVVPGDCNILINSLHPDISTVSVKEVKKFDFDSRLIKK